MIAITITSSTIVKPFLLPFLINFSCLLLCFLGDCKTAFYNRNTRAYRRRTIKDRPPPLGARTRCTKFRSSEEFFARETRAKNGFYLKSPSAICVLLRLLQLPDYFVFYFRDLYLPTGLLKPLRLSFSNKDLPESAPADPYLCFYRLFSRPDE